MIISVFYFLSFLLIINCQNTTNQSTAPTPTPEQIIGLYGNICVPTPIGIDVLSAVQDDCSKLQKYPTNESEFYCCRLEFQERKNKSAPLRKGCMAFLTNYVDNDRYEDIIDYIERGKMDQITQYSIFLGQSASMQFTNFIKNKTKYNVYKFDCFSSLITFKIYLMLALWFILFDIF